MLLASVVAADCKAVLLQHRAALAKTNIREPRIPVISNVDAQPHSDPDVIKDILGRQVSCTAGASASCCSYTIQAADGVHLLMHLAVRER